ncbi:unnamed protein product [Parascedosporium putredinis]|uniref:CENP-V/GFA domain-containing protein n=1 Tax=Parascedosporium putredinis TaxID=1442378 RepID=A0A9P1MFH0_9PEZI|nr:unnamed protein product [Parascedosporium putredinis]CAI8003442.1 unnamed protein product [Parascedosporium putredinis]
MFSKTPPESEGLSVEVGVSNRDRPRPYRRLTSTGDKLHCYFCKTCGTRLVHATPSKNVVSVRGGCIEGLDWSTAIHLWTKSAMVPIPEGCETHSESSPSTDYGETQEVLDQPGDLACSG